MKFLAAILIPASALAVIWTVAAMGYAVGRLIELPNGIPLCLLAVLVLGFIATWLATRIPLLWTFVTSDDRPRRNIRNRRS